MSKDYRRIVLLFVFIACFLLIGCRKNNDLSEQHCADDLTYLAKDIVLEGSKGEVKQIIINEDVIYVLTKEQTLFHLYKSNIDGKNVEEMKIPINVQDGEVYLCVDSEKNIICLFSDDEKKIVVKINELGEMVNQADLKDIITSEDVLDRVAVDALDNIILASSKSIFLMNSDLKLVNTIKINDEYEMAEFCITKSEKLACAMKKENKDGNRAGSGRLKILDVKNGEWDDDFPMPDDLWIDNNCIIGGNEYEFYYKDGFGIYGYDSNKNSWVTVLDARCSMLTTQDIDRIYAEKDGYFWGTISDSSSNSDECLLEFYAKVDAKEKDNKKVIKFATYNVQDPLRVAARDFNKMHDNCRIEIQLYDDEDRTKLGQDIALGNIPDIFNPSELGMPMEQLVKRGIIEDLTPYYEHDDCISIQDIDPSVWEGMKIDDKVYFTAPYFSVWSAASRKDIVGNRTGWTLSEMKNVLKEMGNDAYAFDFTEKEMILDCILLGNLNEFINWQTGECYFDSKDFKDILEFCNEGEALDQTEEEEYLELIELMEEKIKEGKVLMSVDQSVSLSSIQQTRQRFGSDIVYIGLPQSDREGNYFEFNEKYGIYSKSEMKEEAWEFIRMVMTKEYQTNVKLLKYSFFPTRKDCMEWNLEAQMATEPYEDQFGNWIEPIETKTWDDECGTVIKTGPATNEDIKIFRDLISHTHKQTSWDDKAGEIIFEEAIEYFSGKRSLDKTAKIIQKRVKTYVNEKR